MNSILFMNTANDLDRIQGSGTISWITAPTYTLMIPDNAHPMSSDHIDLLSQPSAKFSLISSVVDESLSASRSRTAIQISIRSPEQNLSVCKTRVQRIASRHKHIDSKWKLSLRKFKNGGIRLYSCPRPRMIIPSLISLLPCLIWFHSSINHMNGKVPLKRRCLNT